MIVYRVGVPSKHVAREQRGEASSNYVKFGYGPFTTLVCLEKLTSAKLKDIGVYATSGPYWRATYTAVARRYMRSELSLRPPDHLTDEYPGADEDVDDMSRDDLCAFDSIKQMKHWFDKDFRAVLGRMGAKLYVIDAAEVRVGSRQVVFDPEFAKVVEVIPLNKV